MWPKITPESRSQSLNTNLKNDVQRITLETLADWKPHTLEELVRETGACNPQAFRIQLGELRKKVRKADRDILFQDGIGYRLVSLLPHPSHLQAK
jgi:hypothetical protein